MYPQPQALQSTLTQAQKAASMIKAKVVAAAVARAVASKAAPAVNAKPAKIISIDLNADQLVTAPAVGQKRKLTLTREQADSILTQIGYGHLTQYGPDGYIRDGSRSA